MGNHFRKVVTTIVFLSVSFLVFAWNEQSIIPMDSKVYDAMDAIYVMEGKALPSTT